MRNGRSQLNSIKRLVLNQFRDVHSSMKIMESDVSSLKSDVGRLKEHMVTSRKSMRSAIHKIGLLFDALGEIDQELKNHERDKRIHAA